MKIIKRNGEEVIFDLKKIVTAISKANNEVPASDQLNNVTIESMAKSIEKQCAAANHEMNVEAIQDLVEKAIMKEGAFDIAKKYITYRYQHQLMRQEAVEAFTSKYGPITHSDYDGGPRWKWVDSPWPWQLAEEE